MKEAEERTQGGDVLWPGAVPMVDVSAEQHYPDEPTVPSAWLMVLPILATSITLLVAGSVSRPLFDRYRVSREKLAYLIDSTSAPSNVMLDSTKMTRPVTQARICARMPLCTHRLDSR